VEFPFIHTGTIHVGRADTDQTSIVRDISDRVNPLTRTRRWRDVKCIGFTHHSHAAPLLLLTHPSSTRPRKKINRAHTHTHQQRTTPPTPTHPSVSIYMHKSSDCVCVFFHFSPTRRWRDAKCLEFTHHSHAAPGLLPTKGCEEKHSHTAGHLPVASLLQKSPRRCHTLQLSNRVKS